MHTNDSHYNITQQDPNNQAKFNDLPKVLSPKLELDPKSGFLYHLTKWNLLQIWSFSAFTWKLIVTVPKLSSQSLLVNIFSEK